ncbi:hypothetical protein DM02DRAFT_169548 [Periconia macrospinosa]|uniref:Uncharacterized protein n=1 Tax=Periconia macrospinosa TaxID=97972 RepID=A0A2V1DAD5_9PLEO|nr:hypothetical protein DM02DRAFT_169548 [Periconia macrospinosa]
MASVCLCGVVTHDSARQWRWARCTGDCSLQHCLTGPNAISFPCTRSFVLSQSSLRIPQEKCPTFPQITLPTSATSPFSSNVSMPNRTRFHKPSITFTIESLQKPISF